MGLCSYR